MTTNIEDQMKISRCQWCPVTASIECMRTCLQQNAGDLDRQRMFRRWAWLPPPRAGVGDPDEDRRRLNNLRAAP